MVRQLSAKTTISLLVASLAIWTVAAQSLRSGRDGSIDFLVAVPKPYSSIRSQIAALGGQVRYEYENIDAIAVTVPAENVNNLGLLGGVQKVVRDETIALPEPPKIERPGLGEVPTSIELNSIQSKTLNSQELVGFLEEAPAGYFPTEAALTNAVDFWNATGHFGEGVIVAVMDTGVAEVAALGGRVVGAESFLFATPALEDGLPANSPLNDPHGTWVATTLAANAIFGFLSTDPFASAVRTHLPNAIIPDFFAPGIDGIPMLGQSPLALLYALKIFNAEGLTTNSIILVAYDRAITLKRRFDRGIRGGVNIRVLNGSFGGITLFAAEDPFFAAMLDEVQAAGIVTTNSAGNAGPAGMSGGDPGLARNNLTVGATSIAAHEKIFYDTFVGPPIGSLFRANSLHQTAAFSSRGPTADGRNDPDIVAPGDYIYVQGASGSINLVSGTSFAAPNVAAAAALLFSEHADATPDKIRGALLHGANPNILEDNSGVQDQGYGFLDVLAAHALFSSPNPPDIGLESPSVPANVEALGIDVLAETVKTSTGWLLPGERREYFFLTDPPISELALRVQVQAELPPSQQNPLFGDDALVTVHSGKTSRFADYKEAAFVSGEATFALERPEIDFGLTRVTILGDWTNAGRIRAAVTITKNPVAPHLSLFVSDAVAQGEVDGFLFEMPRGISEAQFELRWNDDWGAWPTDDLDIFLFDPNGNLILVDNDEDESFDGLSFDSPEIVTVTNPPSGTWTIFVNGFTVWEGREPYQLLSNVR